MMTTFIFDHTLIGIIAVSSIGIILIQLLLSVFGGFGEFETDTDGDGAMDFDASIFLSPKGILHFLAGASWTLVLMQKEILKWSDYLIAFAVGIVVVIAIALLYYGLHKLAKENVEEKGEELVGRTVEIYLKTGKDTYDAYITRNETRSMISVKSKKENSDYEPGNILTLASYEDGIYYID